MSTEVCFDHFEVGGGSRVYPVPARCFDTETLHTIIMNREALPLTPDMNAIMDFMYQYGRSTSQLWFNWTLDLLAHTMVDGEPQKKAYFMFATIQYRVMEMIYESILNHYVQLMVEDEWVQHFRYLHEEENETEFKSLAVKSFAYIQCRIRHLTEGGMSIETPNEITPSLVFSFEGWLGEDDICW